MKDELDKYEIVDFPSNVPDGEHRLVVDRVELRLSRKLSPRLAIHLMVTDGAHAGTHVVANKWLNNKRSCLRLYWSLADYCALPKTDFWTEAELNAALAGKKIVAKFITKTTMRGEWRRIELPLANDKAKLVEKYLKEMR